MDVIIPSIIASKLVLPSLGGVLSTGLRSSGRSVRLELFFFDREERDDDREDDDDDREDREDLDLESKSELIVGVLKNRQWK